MTPATLNRPTLTDTSLYCKIGASDGLSRKIVFEDKGPNYQVPGLPYEATFNYVRPVVLDGVPSTKDLEYLLRTGDSDTLMNPWSMDVVKGFKDYIPTTFKRITKGMPRELLTQHFGIEEAYFPESEKVLLQLQTELDAKAATVDAAIITGRRTLGTVVNKAHLANRLYMIGRIHGHLKERPYPELFGDLTDERQWDKALSDMKMKFIEYTLEVPLGKRKYARRVRRVDVSQKEVDGKYAYLNWLKEKLGDDLIGVLVYGSASRTDDPNKYSDFDNWVRVKNVQKAHEILRGTNPNLIDGKVVQWPKGDPPKEIGAKHIGIHLFPESEEYLRRHIRFLHDSREFLENTKVIYGEFPFERVHTDEVVERGISQAHIKLKTIAGSLNWAYFTPEKIQGNPNLFEYIVKNVRFFLQHSLNASGGHKFRGKDELNELLAQRGLFIPEYKDDLKHIQQSLLYAMTSVLQLQQEFVQTKRKPNFSFLTDGKEYDWSGRSFNSWGQVDDE